MKKLLFLIALQFPLLSKANFNAADTSILKHINLAAYLELYAAVDDDDNNTHERPNFLYHNTRSGELALNLGFVKASWALEKMRGNFALMTGTYPERNLASEPEMFQHVYESNIGLKLSKKANLWLDAGIFTSHIGLESAIGKDNPTLTRSLIAENSPYYETGVKCTWISASDQWTIAGLVLNGWQRIYKLDGNYYPATGIQINYKPNEKLQLNYSNYLGDEDPGLNYTGRLYHNFFAAYLPSDSWSFYGAFDHGTQYYSFKNVLSHENWMGWFAIAKYHFLEKFAVAARIEQFVDKDEILIQNPYAKGFVTRGYSLNFDYELHANALLRAEFRRFEGESNTFENRNGELRRVYDGLTVCLSVSL